MAGQEGWVSFNGIILVCAAAYLDILKESAKRIKMPSRILNSN
jgi:hypothetical protein